MTAARTEAAATALARSCAELTWDAIPAAARERTKELVLDLLGVAVRGASAPSSLAVRELVRAQGSGPATVLAASLRASAVWAALANGASAHAIEMDDVTTASSLHPGAVVIPAALAVAEERVREPRNVVDAQFSAPYAAAVALVRGRAGLAEFTDEAIADPRVRALARRATCVRDPSLDAAFPRSWPAAVEIRLRGGRVLRARVDHAFGEPENPVPRGALVDRFVEMVADRAAPDAARRLAARILALEAEPDLGVLRELA